MRPGGARPWGTVGRRAWLPREWGLALRGAQRVDDRHLLLGSGKSLTPGVLLAPCVLGAGRRSPNCIRAGCWSQGWKRKPPLNHWVRGRFSPAQMPSPRPWHRMVSSSEEGVPCLRRPVTVFCVYWLKRLMVQDL